MSEGTRGEPGEAGAEPLPAASAELMTTGVTGLDEMLGGGIPPGSIIYACGSTGSGKTILAQQMAFANAARGANVLYLYLSGFSESLVNRVRGLQAFEFFDPGEFNVGVAYQDAIPLINAAQSSGLVGAMALLFQQHDARLVVIDSIKTTLEKMEEFSRTHETLRQLAQLVSERRIVALLLGGYQQQEVIKLPQFDFADGIIALTAPYESPDGMRYVRVLKMRGANHSTTALRFRIGASGLEVFPELLRVASADPQAA